MTFTDTQRIVFQSQERFRTLNTGRRWGKSTYVCLEAVYKCINYPNRYIFVILPTYDMSEEIAFPIIMEVVSKFRSGIKKVNKSKLAFFFKNGSKLFLKGAQNKNSLRGRGLTDVYMDECKDMASDIFSTIIRPALSDKNGTATLSGTPEGTSSWWYDICHNDTFKHFTFTTLQGGNVTAEEIELARRELDEKTFRQEYEASFETPSSIVYYNFTTENIKDFAYDPSLDTFVTFDFNVSPMTALIVQSKDNLYYVVKEFYLNNSNTQQTCESIREYIKDLQGTLTINGDSSGDSRKTSSSRTDYQIIQEVLGGIGKRYTKNTRRTISIKDRVNSLCGLLRNAKNEIKLYIHSDCKMLIRDLKRVQWKDNFQLDDKNKELTHISDALSYFAYNLENNQIRSRVS